MKFLNNNNNNTKFMKRPNTVRPLQSRKLKMSEKEKRQCWMKC